MYVVNPSLIFRIVTTLVIIVFCKTGLFAQVEEVNENIEKSKKKQVNATTSSTSEGIESNGFIDFIGQVFFSTIGAAQQASLENKYLYPERVSFLASADYGAGITHDSRNFSTGARGNWGIFATDFRYSSLKDYSGKLNTIDWRLLIIRIPIQSLNLEYGLGVTAVPADDVAYTLSSAGFDWKFQQARTNISATYYWGERTSLGSRFKKSFELVVDYEFLNYGHFHMSGLAKYSYQLYFEETNFNILNDFIASGADKMIRARTPPITKLSTPIFVL